MTNWNYNMDEAPKGTHREVSAGLAKDGSPKVRKVYQRVNLLAADGSSDLVTITCWLPDQNRWNMFTKEHPPIAWAEWPTHPGFKEKINE